MKGKKYTTNWKMPGKVILPCVTGRSNGTKCNFTTQKCNRRASPHFFLPRREGNFFFIKLGFFCCYTTTDLQLYLQPTLFFVVVYLLHLIRSERRKLHFFPSERRVRDTSHGTIFSNK